MVSDYIQLMQNRLNHCVETEQYEMAAGFRDLIESKRNPDSLKSQQHHLELLKRYAPDHTEFYQTVKKSYEEKRNTVTAKR